MNRSAERALAIEVRQTTEHIHSSTDPILVDSGENIVEVNQAFLDLHGYDRASDLEGQPLSTVIAEGDRDRVLSIRRDRKSTRLNSSH